MRALLHTGRMLGRVCWDAHALLLWAVQRARKGNARAIKELTWLKRLEMMRDVAAGMHYLHTRKPPVVHGDLRSPNLLLDLTIDHAQPRYHVKIADFGLARCVLPPLPAPPRPFPRHCPEGPLDPTRLTIGDPHSH